MGKTGKWFKSFLTGKKEKEKDQKINTTNNNGSINQSTSTDHQNPKTPVAVVVPRPTTPKEKKRWSFRRSSASSNTTTDATNVALSTHKSDVPKSELPKTAPVKEAPLHEKLAEEVAADADAVDNATVVVKEAAEEAVPFCNPVDQVFSAVRIQAVFRSYLARKALKALRGLVKLQALVRGHLVRKQATATLRCMQALVTAQARARAQRIRSADEGNSTNHGKSTHRRHSHDKIKHSNHEMEENVKIVEMDRGEYRSNVNSSNSYSNPSQQITDRIDNQMSTYYSTLKAYIKQEYPQYSPAPSAITDISPRTCSGHFEDYSFATAQSSPQCYSAVSRPDPPKTPFAFPRPEYAETMSYDYPLYPNYMANTESSRAKLRSQSAPKQRPPEFERQPSRGRRPSVEGRNIPRGAKMQRCSSHVGSTAQNYQYPWSVKLDKSTVSLRDSECGSTCSVATNAYYCRSVVSYDVS